MTARNIKRWDIVRRLHHESLFKSTARHNFVFAWIRLDATLGKLYLLDLEEY